MAYSPYKTPGLLPADNPISSWVEPRRNALLGFGAGMLSNNWGDIGKGTMQGMALDRDYAMDAQQLAQQETERNQTMEWVKANYPQYGHLPPAQAFTLASQADAAKRNGGSDSERFFGTVVPMQDENGNVILGQMSDQGNWQPLQGAEGMSPAPTTKQIDAGNMIITTDVYGNELYRTPKSGSVPTGFSAPDQSGAIAPMTGGPEDRARIEADLQMDQRLQAADQRADIVINAIDSAMDQANFFTTGPIGSAGRAIGATPMVDLEKTIDTVIANIGFNELQQMREMSPTGGALGQVAVQELNMLQSVLASLDPRQGEEQLRRNLQTIKDLLERQKMYRQQAAQERRNALGGGQRQQPQGGPAPSGRTLTYNPATGRLE